MDMPTIYNILQTDAISSFIWDTIFGVDGDAQSQTLMKIASASTESFPRSAARYCWYRTSSSPSTLGYQVPNTLLDNGWNCFTVSSKMVLVCNWLYTHARVLCETLDEPLVRQISYYDLMVKSTLPAVFAYLLKLLTQIVGNSYSRRSHASRHRCIQTPWFRVISKFNQSL